MWERLLEITLQHGVLEALRLGPGPLWGRRFEDMETRGRAVWGQGPFTQMSRARKT